VLAGFCAYLLAAESFMVDFGRGSDVVNLVAVMGIALVFVLLGAWLNTWRHWQRDTGIAILSAMGVIGAAVLVMVSYLLSPQFAQEISTFLAKLNLVQGGILDAGLLLAGLLLFLHKPHAAINP
jgi:FlaA1/EpsC-like NDP-sugar epimerase